jgi:hypothetical protein
VFAEDYSDLLRNCRLFLKAEALGALKRLSGGSARFRASSDRPSCPHRFPMAWPGKRRGSRRAR